MDLLLLVHTGLDSMLILSQADILKDRICRLSLIFLPLSTINQVPDEILAYSIERLIFMDPCEFFNGIY
jgi:hypothetical protein